MEFLTNFLNATFLIATPLLIAGLGLVFSERAGVINIGTEGLMLIGALVGVIGSWASGSALVGALCAMASGIVFSALFGYLTVYVRANQVVTGIALNILASGLTVTLNRMVFGVSGNATQIAVFDKMAIPLLGELPVLGAALFHQPLLVYLALLAVPAAQYFLLRTRRGLHLRAVGENSRACDSLGIAVRRTRFLSVLFAGMLAGLAGAFISMGQVSSFSEGMISGKGFMAVAAVVFGNYHPVGVLLACLMFGGAEALQYRLQAMNSGVPYQFWLMLPYFITIFALCLYRQKSNRPAESGRAYEKG